MRNILLFIILSVMASVSATSQAKPPKESVKGVQTEETPNRLTHGQVQITLKKGITTQDEVLETFGAPNITTIDSSGNEVWTYQKHATVGKSTSSGAYGTIILFGASKSAAGFEESSRTMTLIIKFDKSKKVIDFRSMSSSF